MGFKDIFKKKKEATINRIPFSEIYNYAEEMHKGLIKRKDAFHNSVNERTSKLVDELRGSADELDNLDWDKIKEEDRVKLIVKENLGNYIRYIRKLGNDLELNKDIEKIGKILSDFDRKAGISYGKSTFLIGKELAATKESIRNFLRDLDRIYKDNEEVIRKDKLFSDMKSKLEELNDLNESESRVRDEIKELNLEIDGKDKEKESLKKEIERIRKSPESINREERRQNLEDSKKDLLRKIGKAKESIDFKRLARIWHTNEKEMDYVKRYRDDFEEAFNENKGMLLTLINSLDNREEINEILEEITELDKKIKNIVLGEDPVNELDRDLEKSEIDIKNLGDEIIDGEKRINRLNVQANDTRKEIIQLAKDAGVEVIN